MLDLLEKEEARRTGRLTLMILKLFSIVLFCIYCYGTGYTFTRFVRRHSLEINVMRFGIGLGSIPAVMILLNQLGVPVDWRVLFVLSILVPAWDFLAARRRKQTEGERPPGSRLPVPVLTALAVTAISIVIYCGGPFTYPWLEDDDSWDHAAAVKFIAVEQHIHVPPGTFQYVNPYPPGYDLILAILHQTTPSVYWTIKFFNGLIIAWGILFFFYFSRELSRRDDRAALATVFLASIPCYLSHFIWAHALVVTLFFPAWYTILKTREDRRFIGPAILVNAGILLTHPLQAVKYFIMLLMLVLAFQLSERKLWKQTLGILSGAGLLSLSWWLPIFLSIKSGALKILMRSGTSDLGGVEQSGTFLAKIFSPTAGTATRSYVWQDYFFPPISNLINNPTGVGSTLCVLAVIGIIYAITRGIKEASGQKAYFLTLISWLIFTFLGMNSQTFHLPVGLIAFRFWMLFAIPVSMLAAEGFFWVLQGLTRPLVRKAMAVMMMVSILGTSAYFKVHVNSGPWPWGVYWTSSRELTGYIWLREHLPPGTKVFAFMKNYLVIGHDMHADYWSPSYQKDFAGAAELSTQELHDALKRHGFAYVIVGEREIKEFGTKKVEELLNRMNDGQLFEYVGGVRNSVWVFKTVVGRQ